jgi:hypothetical protein
MKCYELGEICPDEILELSFEGEDQSTKHMRMLEHKTPLYSAENTFASIDSLASNNLSAPHTVKHDNQIEGTNSGFFVVARCKNSVTYTIVVNETVQLQS